MSFKTNDCQQITFNDVLWGLTDREKRMLEKSWAKPFAERIFPLIDESKFACLYSDKASRPNTPVNICVGALILKELFNMTDEEMVDSLVFDVRFQYALHTTGFFLPVRAVMTMSPSTSSLSACFLSRQPGKMAASA